MISTEPLMPLKFAPKLVVSRLTGFQLKSKRPKCELPVYTESCWFNDEPGRLFKLGGVVVAV